MKKLSQYLPILSLVYLAACAGPVGNEFGTMEQDDNFGIVGGEVVRSSDPVEQMVPLMEKITLRGGKKYSSSCSTALVHKRILLTAAHCLPETEKGEKAALKIRFNLPNKKTTLIEVIDWQAHPQEDLAVLELASDAPASAKILLLPEPRRSYDPQSIDVAGYGVNTGQVGADAQSGILRKTSLDVVSYRVDANLIQVDQSRGKGLCKGDSGAPGLIHDGQSIVLIGIGIDGRGASKNNVCDLEGYFVNLSVYLDWIFQTAREIQVRTSRPENQL